MRGNLGSRCRSESEVDFSNTQHCGSTPMPRLRQPQHVRGLAHFQIAIMVDSLGSRLLPIDNDFLVISRERKFRMITINVSRTVNASGYENFRTFFCCLDSQSQYLRGHRAIPYPKEQSHQHDPYTEPNAHSQRPRLLIFSFLESAPSRRWTCVRMI